MFSESSTEEISFPEQILNSRTRVCVCYLGYSDESEKFLLGSGTES